MINANLEQIARIMGKVDWWLFELIFDWLHWKSHTISWFRWWHGFSLMKTWSHKISKNRDKNGLAGKFYKGNPIDEGARAIRDEIDKEILGNLEIMFTQNKSIDKSDYTS